jgi:competence protein ComEA
MNDHRDAIPPPTYARQAAPYAPKVEGTRAQGLISALATLTILAAIIGGGVLLWTARPAPVTIIIQPPPPTTTPRPTMTPAPLNVRVMGAVNLPDIALVVPPGSRVRDALDGAGGARPDANLGAVDLNRPLSDGEIVYIPRIGETPPTSAPRTPSAVGDIVFINRATAAELETLPGIGAALAARIIAHRAAHGAFRSMADVDAVDGIGESVIAGLAGRIAFD